MDGTVQTSNQPAKESTTNDTEEKLVDENETEAPPEATAT